MVTSKYNPIYFLSDYDNLYPVVVKDVVAKIIIMKDFVHTIRQFYKDQKTAINKVKVNGISHLGKEKQKAIIDLKKSLLRKRMNKGTSAITRAGIDLNEFGARDFFEAIDLRGLLFNNPSIIEITIIDNAILEDFIAA